MKYCVYGRLCIIYGFIESICIQRNIFVSGCLLMATMVGAEEEEDALWSCRDNRVNCMRNVAAHADRLWSISNNKICRVCYYKALLDYFFSN